MKPPVKHTSSLKETRSWDIGNPSVQAMELKYGNQTCLSVTVFCNFTDICDVMLTGKGRVRVNL